MAFPLLIVLVIVAWFIVVLRVQQRQLRATYRIPAPVRYVAGVRGWSSPTRCSRYQCNCPGESSECIPLEPLRAALETAV